MSERKQLTKAAVDQWLEAKLSPETRRAYEHDWAEWINWLADNEIAWSDARPHHVVEWRNDLISAQHSVATVRRRLSSVSSFYAFHRYPSPTTGVDVPSRAANVLPRWLDASQLDRFLQAALSLDGNDHLIGLLLMHALRRSEVTQVLVKDVMFQRLNVMLVRGKGGKVRTIPAREELQLAVVGLEASENTLLIAKPDGSPVSGDAVYRSCLKIAKVAGLPGASTVGPHVIRRSVATKAMQSGVPLNQIQALLGHRFLDTTAQYLQPAAATENQAVDAAFQPASSSRWPQRDPSGTSPSSVRPQP